MKELVIISGKGGTGKTSIVASFASLAKNKVIVDADVDAADLHLVIPHSVKRAEDFQGGHTAIIDADICTGCGECKERCQFDAITDDFVVDKISCEGCSVCVHFCPADAIQFPKRTCGRWFISDTEHGPMVHARLGIAEENSGLLVSLLRREAKEIAENQGLETIIIDGSPGIGCPVIASVTGSNTVLIVTEPTMSGMHDMDRIKRLADFLKVPAMVCINKYDINMDITSQIEAFGNSHNLKIAGLVPYDKDVTSAMVAQKSLVEFSKGEAATAVRNLWNEVEDFMSSLK
ncbi:(4Fe-4S)-binding protein [Candidatus Woesearchaeota archaeon]|nr:MAG: (4Fe-4S)-binding protein [Candidatus Woesearchaeota archaeon]